MNQYSREWNSFISMLSSKLSLNLNVNVIMNLNLSSYSNSSTISSFSCICRINHGKLFSNVYIEAVRNRTSNHWDKWFLLEMETILWNWQQLFWSFEYTIWCTHWFIIPVTIARLAGFALFTCSKAFNF